MAAHRWRCAVVAGCYAVAIVELVLGVVAGNFVGVLTGPWLDCLASFAGAS
jgi:hypothetical protein